MSVQSRSLSTPRARKLTSCCHPRCRWFQQHRWESFQVRLGLWRNSRRLSIRLRDTTLTPGDHTNVRARSGSSITMSLPASLGVRSATSKAPTTAHTKPDTVHRSNSLAGQDKGAYHHPFFLEGRRNLCRFIQRVKVKGKGPRKPVCRETEPDFYSNPLPEMGGGGGGGTGSYRNVLAGFRGARQVPSQHGICLSRRGVNRGAALFIRNL